MRYTLLHMARRFQGLQFGPMHLRPVLRRRRERDEHIIAWGSATAHTEGRSAMLLAHAVPVFGPAMAAAAASSSKRFVVVTSRRVLVLLNKSPKRVRRDLAVWFESPHEYLVIQRPSAKKAGFALATAGQAGTVAVSVDNPKTKGGKRLTQALQALIVDVGGSRARVAE